MIGERLRFQAVACEEIGSPLYASLLRFAAEDFEAGGPARTILAGHGLDPGPSALGLRLMGAVHRLVLAGATPDLAERYRAGDGEDPATRSAFRAALEEHAAELSRSVERPVQTNEVGRGAALLPGFLTVAEETGLPLRLLEVGTSAGLNLRWDSYRFEAPGFAWGPPRSPVRIEFELSGEMPEARRVEVSERRGCDASPVDPLSEDGRQTLLAYVWPDQAARMKRMRAAIRLAGELPVAIDSAEAAPWVAARLAEPAHGATPVVFHSIVMQYLSEDERDDFGQVLARAGEGADAAAPLAWLRMEPGSGGTEVRLTTWPGGEDRLLARAGYHGSPVECLAGDAGRQSTG